MRRAVTFVCIFWLFLTPKMAHTETDKLLHGTVSYGVATSLSLLFMKTKLFTPWEAVLFSSFATMLAGFVKEASDPRFEGADIRANAIGVGLSAGFMLSLGD